MRDQRVHCPVGDEVIGVYERAVVLDRQGARATSLANEPSLRGGQQAVVHHGCAGAVLDFPTI